MNNNILSTSQSKEKNVHGIETNENTSKSLVGVNVLQSIEFLNSKTRYLLDRMYLFDLRELFCCI
jgi:hypothetical protein